MAMELLKRWIILCLVLFWSVGKNHSPPERYWIWSGVSTSHAPSHAIIYIYQGFWDRGTFYHKGIYPFPAPQKEGFLTYRIEGSLPNAKKVCHLFLTHHRQWQKHGIHIKGLQIDYDSPSKRLDIYLAFLQEIRTYLPPSLTLSITALSDWLMSADPTILDKIGQTTQEVVFQLYHHHTYIHPIQPYLNRLKAKKFPYALGIFAHQPLNEAVDDYLPSPYYRGVIKFIQKQS